MKREVYLTLEMETEDELTEKDIEKDLMAEISCASYDYKLKSIRIMKLRKKEKK